MLTLNDDSTASTSSGTLTVTPPAQGATTLSGSGIAVTPGSNDYTGGTIVNGGALLGSWDVNTAAANNTYTGGTTVNAGVLTLNAVATDWSAAGNGDFVYSLGAYGGAPTVGAPRSPIMPIPRGPVFYIITEGAGLGDSVRTVPCTGNETVLSAMGAVGGISQVSSTKIWIARPMPHHSDKSTMLFVDWEAVSKRGVNATNYTLMPGDRLVIGEDPQMTRSNLLSKKTSPIERINGVVGLTASTLRGMQNTPDADKLVKNLVENNMITDDEQLKKFILDAIRNQENKKPGTKAAEKPTAGEKEGKSTVGDGTATLVFQVAPETEKPKPGGDAKEHNITLRGTLVFDVQSPDAPTAATPHELATQPLPAYRIEPPDVISITMLKQSKAVDSQPVAGQYLVGPDGTINLNAYGLAQISGKSVAEAKAAVENQLKKYFDKPEVSVNVVAYNSKVYYIITQGAGLGDSVRRMPITGNETVLDAISQINGLSQVSDCKKIWIVRPSPSDSQKATVLPADWRAITRRGETATNYQLFPRDRVYIGEDAQITGSNVISKNTAPIERAMGIISLTTSTLQSMGNSPGGAAAVKELVKRGVFDSDPQVKRIVEETIRLGDEASKKAVEKTSTKSP
jgi:protein involved in polysaccharide export with SLBB domain